MNKIKGILFDLDGTICDSQEGITKSVQYALNSFNIKEENLSKLKVFIGPPLIESFMEHYNFSKENAILATEKYRERYNTKGMYEIKIYPNVKETLIKLKELGIKIGLASSKPEYYCTKILEHLQIANLFDTITGSTFDEKVHTKEQVLSVALNRWNNVPKENICLIGDTKYDAQGAISANLNFIGVTYGFGTKNELLTPNTIKIINTINELFPFITNFI